MKKTCRNCLVVLILLWCKSVTFAQTGEVLLTASFENTTLETALEYLQHHYDIAFAYSNRNTENVTVNCQFTKTPLEQALRELLSETNLTFQLLSQKQVLVGRKNEPALDEGSKHTLSGKVIDAWTNAPLAYATVAIKGKANGATTNENGQFSIRCSANDQLVIQYLGYHAQTFSLNDKSLDALLIRLEPEIQHIPPIEVVGTLPILASPKSSASSTALSLQADALQYLPNLPGGTDVFRSIQLLPGISAMDDLSTDIKIRGSSGDESMIVLDGITLYGIDHFFGVFSAVNAEVVDEIKVYKNAFPAYYGGRTAGVVEMSSPSILQKKWNGSIATNTMLTSAALDIPLGENMGLLLAGRLTNQDVADTKFYGLIQENQSRLADLVNNMQERTRPNLLTEQPDFNFYDLNAKWSWQISPKTQLNAHYFRGEDDFSYQYDLRFDTRLRNRVVRAFESYQETAEWLNEGWSFRAKQDWTSNFSTELQLSGSEYKEDARLQTRLVRPVLQDSVGLSNRQYNRVQGYDWGLKNHWQIDEKNALDFGYNGLRNEVNLTVQVDDRRPLERELSAWQHAFYGQYNFSDDNWQALLGLRSTYFSLDNQLYLSPRLQLGYDLSENWQLKGSWSQYNQFVRQIYYEDRFGRNLDFWIIADNDRFPVAQARQLMLGFNHQNSLFQLDVEFYQKNTDGVIAYALQAPGFNADDPAPPQTVDNYNIFEGEGQSTGMDVLLQSKLGKYEGWLAYTLSETINNFREINRNRPFPAQNDRRHQLKFVNLFRQNRWAFSANYIFASGRPYVDISRLSAADSDRRNLDIDRFIQYLDDYHRVDVGTSYTFPIGSTSGKIGFSIFNLFNHSNIKYRQYIFSIPNSITPTQNPVNVPTGTELELLDRTFDVSLEWRF